MGIIRGLKIALTQECDLGKRADFNPTLRAFLCQIVTKA